MRTLDEIEKEIKALTEEKQSIVNAEKEKKAEEQNTRYDEVKKAYTNYVTLKDSYINDYGSISFEIKDDTNDRILKD